jgi:serine/threonine protein kinase
VGQQFGNYRLTSLLGRGGFAEVYLGEHVYLKTQAAIKILQTRLSQEEQESFYAEARTVAHLQNEHIVRVLEFGLKDGSVPYLVMEYAPNGTLRERFPRGTPIAPEQIIPPFKQVAAALEYAHGENLIHRDIKPENMLLGSQNEVLLSDFGVALMIKGSRNQNAQDVAGTVTYMSPEQLMGRPTRASDQYSLGVVIYEWLTGTRLFSGSFTEVATQHIVKPPPSLRERVPTIPEAVDRVVLKSLAKDPQQRFASVQDFANALEAAIQGQPESLNGTGPKFPLSEHTTNGSRGVSSVTTETIHQQYTSFPPTMASKRPRTLSRIVKIGLLAFALILIAGGGLAYALLRPQSADAPPQDGQALYAQATRGAPQISDALSAESSLSWLPGSVKTCQFKDGALHGLSTDGVAVCGTTFIYLKNLAYQAEATILHGKNAGLIFRNELLPSPYGGVYHFLITPDGNFELNVRAITRTNGQLSSSGERQLISPRHSAAIKTGLGQTNLLTIITSGPDIYLYVNKQFVGYAKDSTSQAGTIGLMSLNTPGSAIDVAFKNVQIWIL